MAIWFNSEIKNFNLKNKRKLKNWINNTISRDYKKTGNINYIFVDDPTLYKINSEYLHHRTYTDIISFDYSNEELISGDIYISLDRVKENSFKYNVSFNEELKRVIIHGILHFLGFKDFSSSDKEKMRCRENELLSNVKELLITSE